LEFLLVGEASSVLELHLRNDGLGQVPPRRVVHPPVVGLEPRIARGVAVDPEEISVG